MLESLDLEAAADRRSSTYSGGMRRRLDVGLGIVHRPAVLFLDEPTTGLDPQARARMWDEIRSLRERGTTVFLTTHYLEEADALCDRLAIIDHGRIVAEGTSDELKRPSRATSSRSASTRRASASSAWSRARRSSASPRRARTTLVRLYVERGETAVPQLLRVLDGAGLGDDLDLAPQAEPRRRLPPPDRPLAARGAGR